MTHHIGIIGACGRMGRAILDTAAQRDDVRIVGLVEHAGHPALGTQIADMTVTDDLDAVAARAAILIDFSRPDGLESHIHAAQKAACAFVVGTTGLTPAHHALLDQAAQHIPLLQAANMSLGVNLLAALVEESAARLGPEWDIEIVEVHHRHKADAPSGTSLFLGQAAAQGRGIDLEKHSIRTRDGIIGPRPVGDIGFATLRGGSVAGDHMVIFAGDGERIELGHRADSREIFAKGALQAAVWIASAQPGRYDMRDVLGMTPGRAART